MECFKNKYKGPSKRSKVHPQLVSEGFTEDAYAKRQHQGKNMMMFSQAPAILRSGPAIKAIPLCLAAPDFFLLH